MTEAMPQLQPVLDHIAIYITDLKKSSAFYRDVLGLDPLPELFAMANMPGSQSARANNCISSKEQSAGRKAGFKEEVRRRWDSQIRRGGVLMRAGKNSPSARLNV
jgi:hypothetical protein